MPALISASAESRRLRLTQHRLLPTIPVHGPPPHRTTAAQSILRYAMPPPYSIPWAATTYRLVWTVTNKPGLFRLWCGNRDTVVIRIDYAAPTVVDAGPDQTLCFTTTNQVTCWPVVIRVPTTDFGLSLPVQEVRLPTIHFRKHNIYRNIRNDIQTVLDDQQRLW